MPIGIARGPKNAPIPDTAADIASIAALAIEKIASLLVIADPMVFKVFKTTIPAFCKFIHNTLPFS